MLDTFENGSLVLMDVLQNGGYPHVTAPIGNPISMAKSFLLNYQNYAENSLYGQLASTLNKADPFVNSTSIVGNLKFEITATYGNSTMGESSTFTWSYTVDGVNAPCKCVSLGYTDGFLKVFIDNWNIYSVGSTIVNISEQTAENIAMKNAKTYSYTVGSGNEMYIINHFNVTQPMYEELIFSEVGNAPDARSSNPLELYPMWRIGVGLDKYYPDNVYGFYVDVWADTGQVRDIQQAFSTLPPPANDTATIAESSVSNKASIDSSSFSLLTIAPFAFISLFSATFSIWLNRRKTTLHFYRLPKMRKISGALLCLLMGIATMATIAFAAPVVNASSFAQIYGDDHQDPVHYQNPHTPQEVYLQGMISANISSWYATDGYSASNDEGDNTCPEVMLPHNTYNSQYSSSISTIYFDHGVGENNTISQSVLQQIPNWTNWPNEFHFMLSGSFANENDPANDIFDYQIYNSMANSNAYFTFIDACYSAALSLPPNPNPPYAYTGSYGSNSGGTGAPIGMPYAWTHEYATEDPSAGNMSNDGYRFPDQGKYCYIGFPTGSAALSQTIDQDYPNTIFYDFVYCFFYYALCCNYLTVNQALDAASYMCFNEPFGSTMLHLYFQCDWPGVTPQYVNGCSMVVYGNGNIGLYPGGPDYVTTPSISCLSQSPYNTSQPISFSVATSDIYNPSTSLSYTVNWGDGSSSEPISNPSDFTYTYASAGTYTITVTAQNPSTGVSNTNTYTISVQNPQPTTFSLTVDAYCIDDELQVCATVDSNQLPWIPYTVQVTQGYHSICVDSQSFDPNIDDFCNFWFFDAATNNGNYYYYSNPASIPIYSDTTVYAMYYPE